MGAQGVEHSDCLEAATERCISFTEASEAEAIICTLDDVMLQYLAMLHETLNNYGLYVEFIIFHIVMPLVYEKKHDLSKRKGCMVETY